METTKSYVVVSETDYYGPATRWSVVVGDDGRPVEYETEAAALEAAADYDPDYDPSVGCCRLRHNQSSPTRGLAAELVTDAFDANDWHSFEDCAADLWDAAVAAYERDPGQALTHALEESDYVVGPGGESLYRIL